MTDRRRLNLSLNLSVHHQREAWGILRAIPSGKRTDAVCRMICQARTQEKLLDAMRAMLREELRGVELVSAKEKSEQPQTGGVDENVLGFLRSLQNDGGEE